MSSRHERAYDRGRADREPGTSKRWQGRNNKWESEETPDSSGRRRSVSKDQSDDRRQEPRRYRSRSRSPNHPPRRRSRSPANHLALHEKSRPQQYHRQRSRSRSPTRTSSIPKDRRDVVLQGPSASSTANSMSHHRPKNQQVLDSKSKSLEREEGEGEGEEDFQGPKDEPNFNPSGKLAAETNTFKGVVLKYHEPPEARKPTNKNWRLYVFKGKEQLDLFHIHRQSAYLFGRDRLVADIPIDHPSSSKQHAVIQFRQICSTNEFGDSKTLVKPFIIDLESANGTFVNQTKIPQSRYYELKSGDVIKFGCSTREFVLIPET